jgi:hypothetical protein
MAGTYAGRAALNQAKAALSFRRRIYMMAIAGNVQMVWTRKD